jgi:hypothetical protein
MVSSLPHADFVMSSSTPPLPMMKKKGKINKFADNYVPGKYAVICGRGKACTASTGNRNLRSLVMSYLKPYSQSRNKVEKSSIVSAIMTSVRQASPDGAFVKIEAGVWREVDEGFAREKIGCLFRDYLHTQYRSSTKAKLARRKVTSSSFKYMNGGSDHSHSSTHMMMNGSNQSSSSCMTDKTNTCSWEPLSTFSSGTDKFAQAGAPVTDMNNCYSLLSSFLNQQQPPPRHQEPRPDFLLSCLPSMPIEGQGTSRDGSSSLLQDACNVVMRIGNEGCDDDIPDDISDIFEDDLSDPFAAF